MWFCLLVSWLLIMNHNDNWAKFENECGWKKLAIPRIRKQSNYINVKTTNAGCRVVVKGQQKILWSGHSGWIIKILIT